MKTNKTTRATPARRIAAAAKYYREKIDPAATCDGAIVKSGGVAVWCLTAEEYAATFHVDIKGLASYEEAVEHDGLLFIVFPC